MKNERKLAIIKNVNTYERLVDYYFNINQNIFEWLNVPDTFDAERFERHLFFKGKAVLLERKKGNYLALKGYETGEKNVYGESTSINCTGFAFSMTAKRIFKYDKSGKCILCNDNLGKTNTSDYVCLLVHKLSEMYRLYDNIIFQSKRPYIIGVEDSQKLATENLLKDTDINTPYIIGFKTLENIEERIHLLDLPNRIKDLDNVLNQIVALDNQIRKVLGVYNNETSKKERLVVDEINANNVATTCYLESRYKARKEFVELVNEVFNLNIDVKVNDSIVLDNQQYNLTTSPPTTNSIVKNEEKN